jgi:hypothetical protein
MTKRILAIVGLLLLGAGVGLTAANQKEAQTRVAAIVAKDNQGQETATDLNALKSYAAAHINGSATVTLIAAFQRAQAQAQAQSEAASSSNKLYSEAQQVCSGHTDSITQARCVQAYVSQRLVAAPAPSQVTAPLASNFVFVYKSPLWTPDTAGACLLGGIAVLLMVGFMTVGRNKYER